MEAIRIDASGQCSVDRDIKYSKSKFTWKRKALHIHFHETETHIVLLSPISQEVFLKSGNSEDMLHTLRMPPPLNHYVYPQPLFAMSFDGNNPCSLSIKEFLEKCDSMRAHSHKLARLQLAIYEVLPEHEAIPEEEDELFYDEELDQENSEEEGEEDDSEDWEFDEEEAPE